MIRKLRLFFIFLLVIDLGVLGLLIFFSMRNQVPDRLFAFVGREEDIPLPSLFTTEDTVETLKVTNKEDGFSVASDRTGDYSVQVKLFGIVPVKQVDVHVIQQMKVSPCGEPIGIYVETRGLLVLDTAEIVGKDKMIYSPGANILKTGDYILKWNDIPVATIQALNEAVQNNGKKKAKLLIRRGGEEISVALRPILASDRKYKIGVWVREDTQGIGTLTYIKEDGTFGTLGHGITDSDTGGLLDLRGGELYRTKILGIDRGTQGEPGELQGYINMVATNIIGTIEKNTSLGVFGSMEPAEAAQYAGEYLPVAMKQDIKKGDAWIYANLDGGPVEKYKISIRGIELASRDNKSMEIEIVDKRLLTLTGGIVQGMSGSPIVQDGNVIGAVTHVLVDDPTRGYGVFIEEMLGE